MSEYDGLSDDDKFSPDPGEIAAQIRENTERMAAAIAQMTDHIQESTKAMEKLKEDLAELVSAMRHAEQKAAAVGLFIERLVYCAAWLIKLEYRILRAPFDGWLWDSEYDDGGIW